MRRHENGLRALLLILLSAAGLQAAPQRFRMATNSEAGGKAFYIAEASAADPAGWSRVGFDDRAWEDPQTFPNGWLAGVLQLPWRSYATHGRSIGKDRLLYRLPLDLPRGLLLGRADLELVVDDNVEIWINGQRALGDPVDLFVPQQPRRFDLRRWFKPCANVLGLRVTSPRPVGVGYKFKLTLEGRQDPELPCESPTPTLSASPTRRVSDTPTARPTETPAPTSPPTEVPTRPPAPRATPRPYVSQTRWPTPKPRPTLAPAKPGQRRPSPALSPPARRRPSLAPSREPVATATATPCVAPSPRPTPKGPWAPRVLAQRRDFWMGDGGADALTGPQKAGRAQARGELRLAFTLERPARVWAEAQGLAGLRSHESDAAPEVFLDDQYLGPLRVEHSERWRSPKALQLQAGPHTLSLRLAQAQDAADVSMQAFQALSDGVPPTPEPGPCDEGRRNP